MSQNSLSQICIRRIDPVRDVILRNDSLMRYGRLAKHFTSRIKIHFLYLIFFLMSLISNFQHNEPNNPFKTLSRFKTVNLIVSEVALTKAWMNLICEESFIWFDFVVC